jgi:hypothetical protein
MRANQGIGCDDGYVYAAVRWPPCSPRPLTDQVPTSTRIYRVEPLAAETLERDPDEILLALDRAQRTPSGRM